MQNHKPESTLFFVNITNLQCFIIVTRTIINRSWKYFLKRTKDISRLVPIACANESSEISTSLATFRSSLLLPRGFQRSDSGLRSSLQVPSPAELSHSVPKSFLTSIPDPSLYPDPPFTSVLCFYHGKVFNTVVWLGPMSGTGFIFSVRRSFWGNTLPL